MLTVGDEQSSIATDADAVYRPELARARTIGIDGRPAPVHQELAVAIEFRDAGAGVAVGDEEGAVGKPRDISRSIEVVRSSPGHTAFAHRLHELAVVGEHVEIG